MMKVSTLIVAIVIVSQVAADPMKNCFDSANDFKDATYKALNKRDTEMIIDELENVF